MKHKLLIIGFIFFHSLVTGYTQVAPERVITLQECLKMAIENSPKLKISVLEQNKLRYKYKETIGKGLPNINISGAFDNYVSLPTQLIPGEFFGRPGELIQVQFGTTYNLTAELAASQLIYNQQYLVGVRMSKLMMDQNFLANEKTKTDVIFEVAQSYYLTQIIRNQIQNQQDNLRKLEKAEKIASSQYESGLIKKIDLDRIVVQKLNLQTEIDRLQVLLEQGLNMQRYYMGLPMDQPISFPDSIPASTLNVQAAQDLSKHIDIRLLEMQKRLIYTNLKLNQAGYFPSLSLIAGLNYNNQSNTYYVFGKSTEWFNTSLVGLRLNVPVFNGLQRHSRVSQSRVELQQLQVAEDDTRKLLQIQSQDAARKLLASIAAEKRQRENMHLANRVYDVSQDQYQKGIIPLTDLLNAETAMSDAQTSHTMALVQMKIAELEYLNANGDLLEIVQ
ncbi:MAG: TolC family protein [Bacteroidales bacterium]|nr:TolC family protein [Bacteroidales bacterium]